MRQDTRQIRLKCACSTGLIALVAVGLSLAAATDTVRADADSRPPNILFIFMDDLGWADVGYQGSTYYETPNVDRLARQGMVFTNAYSNGPNCAPTRACLLSGQYGPRHGVYTVGSSERGSPKFRKLIPTANNRNLAAEVVTFAEALKPAGYTTGCFGKWHLGKLLPMAQGFDVAMDSRKYTHVQNDRLITDAALQFIEANKDKPFLCYLAHHLVHSPWHAAEDRIAKYNKKTPGPGQANPTYAAMVETADQQVGEVLDKLDQLNLTEKTVVFFFSDNGGVGVITSNAPLRGAKGMLYEGGIRVPMIVRWPGKVRPGSTCHTPVIGVDFYPTFLDIAGAQKPDNHVLDGVSLMPLLSGQAALKPRALYWHFPAYLQAWPFIHIPWRTTPAAAVRQGDWKLLEFFEDGRLELYNLKDDIGETNNLAQQMPEKASALHKVMRRWRQAVGAPVPTEQNPGYDPEAEYQPKKKISERFPPFLEGPSETVLQRGY